LKKQAYTKEQRIKIDKQLRGLSEGELQDLTRQGDQILRERNRNKQREYNARYRQRIAMAQRMGLSGQGDE